MEPLAKPSGILYADHRQHVVDQAAAILRSWDFLPAKYLRLTGRDLREDLELAAWWHDAGKQHPDWQVPCQRDYEHYRQWRVNCGLPPDVVSATDYQRYEREQEKAGVMVGRHLFQAGLRHEFASLLEMDRSGIVFEPAILAAVAAHHGKLSFLHKHRWNKDGARNELEAGPFLTYFERMRGQRSRLSLMPGYKKVVQERFKFGAVRSLLQLADTRASRMESNGPDSLVPLERFALTDRFAELRPVQAAALELADQPIAILRAPTGSGKTYASLLWAEQQVRNGRADRLVIAMPTRFTSNALAASAGRQMGAVGLYHSSAWYHRFGDLSGPEKYQAREIHRMARFLATPVNVCTVDHLLIALTGSREHHHHTFYFLANSAVVFDEADFYDPFIQASIVVLIDVLRILDVPVLIMSATVPDSALQLYRITHPIQAAPAETAQLEVTKQISWLGDVEEPQAAAGVMDKMLAAGHGIVYANTVARALRFYDYLERRCRERDIPLVLYHSRFTEPDKKMIEEQLLTILGEEAWRGAVRVKGIAVLTQIGEMSVNISAPLMLSDGCPWDRLAQRIGRLVRFSEADSGTCFVMNPVKAGSLYPAPYGEYDKGAKAWKAFPAMTDTLQQIRERNAFDADADFLVDRVNELYATLPEMSSGVQLNQTAFKELIRSNWLILPNTRVEEDDAETDDWSSRKIPPQVLVFINEEVVPPHFANYEEYQALALEQSCSVPLYLIEKENRRGADLQRVGSFSRPVGHREDIITIHYLNRQELYDPKRGLAFLYEV